MSSLWEAQERLNIVLVVGRWGDGGGGRKEKNPYAAREMNLMISGGRGEDHHSLLLTIKIRLASTVSTLASVKAWQGREGGQPPRGCLRVCHVNYGDPTVPFTDCSGLKEIHNPFLLASTVTDGISALSFLYFGNSLLLFLLPCFIKPPNLRCWGYNLLVACETGQNINFICEQWSVTSPSFFHFFFSVFFDLFTHPHFILMMCVNL